VTREIGSASDWDGDATKGAGVIGKNIRIKGVVRGKEDLVVEGEVDGSITLPEHHIVLERPSRTTAEVKARNATIRGRHRGNAEAIDKIEITSEAVMIGDLKAPRLVIREGAKFRGAVDMDVPLPPGLEVGERKTQERSEVEGESQGPGRKRKNRSSTSGE
jgi:cytoskeletal protein CcmA (bactofilin family)